MQPSPARTPSKHARALRPLSIGSRATADYSSDWLDVVENAITKFSPGSDAYHRFFSRNIEVVKISFRCEVSRSTVAMIDAVSMIGVAIDRGAAALFSDTPIDRAVVFSRSETVSVIGEVRRIFKEWYL